MSPGRCPFCVYAQHAAHTPGEYSTAVDVGGRTITFDGGSPVMWFEPLNPVTPGHMLFVPTEHAVHRANVMASAAFRSAYNYATTGARSFTPFNLVLSGGEAATQTVEHLHVHYVPRRAGDGLTLPWTGQTR